MSVDDQVRSLRSRVTALNEEFSQAISLHEAWKPTVFDSELLARMGESYATNTFLVIRRALRREMLMALMRIWDPHKDGPKLSAVVELLKNWRVVQQLVLDATSQWRSPEAASDQDMPSAERRLIEDALAEQYAPDLVAEKIRITDMVSDILELIASYQPGGVKSVHLSTLSDIRDQYFAHRQLKRDPLPADGADNFDTMIEQIYQDTSQLVYLARQVAESTDLQLDQVAGIRRGHAELFWATVRGERTEGHPAYRRPVPLVL